MKRSDLANGTRAVKLTKIPVTSLIFRNFYFDYYTYRFGLDQCSLWAQKSAKFFPAFLHWNFVNSGVFSPTKNRCFRFPPKTVDSCGSRHLALVCHTNRWENLQNSKDLFFFWDQHKIREKDASVRAMTFFFFFEITLKPDKKDEKIFGIFTLHLEHSHYFRHFRRGWKLRGSTGLEFRLGFGLGLGLGLMLELRVSFFRLYFKMPARTQHSPSLFQIENIFWVIEHH